MTVQDITNLLEEKAPLSHAEDFDNVGLLVGDPGMEVTGVLVTHEIHKVFEVVDRVAFLHEGRIQAQGRPDEILDSEDPLVRQFVQGEIEGPISVE